MKRKSLLFVSIVTIIVQIMAPVLHVHAANSSIQVNIDGKQLDSDSPPIMENVRVLVPMRAIFEALGYSVTWSESDSIAYGKRKDGNAETRYSVRVLERLLWVNYIPDNTASTLNEIDFTLPLGEDAPVKIINGRIYLPTRAIAEGLECSVTWDGNTQTVFIHSEGAAIKMPADGWIGRLEQHISQYCPDMMFLAEGYRKRADMPVQVTEPIAHIPEQNDTQQGNYSVFSPSRNRTFTYDYHNPDLPKNAPQVGVVLANILLDQTKEVTGWYEGNVWHSNVYEAYSVGIVGGCNWYAEGRFWEVYGIPMPYFDFIAASNYLEVADSYEEFTAIRDIYDIRDLSVVVFGETTDTSITGHVAFIEWVERDSSGKPETIYFSEANANNATGRYRHGIDGAVKSLSFHDFLNRIKPVIGYIVPNPDFYS